MELNRNQFMMLGVLVLLFGVQFRMVDYFVLNAEASEFVAKKLKENDFEIALRRLERRKVVSSIDGMVVQIHRRRGEWVEPGQTVMRIIRINRLRAEGLLDVRDVRDDLTGRRVTLSVVLPGGASAPFRGKIVFVSPEVSPVSGQVRIWAEIDNPKLTLRPGLNASMVIESDDATAAPK
ncbi:MAG: HlyD family secretion protein [Chloroflexi bacterium]|nr:HlyD family secretion protein [Chloroflexota bacterium]